METIIYIYETRPYLLIGVFGILFIFFSLIMYVFFYIYMNINLKGISKIIFKDGDKYRRPLEPFSFVFLSFLPTTFWREILNIKYQLKFKRLYGKEFYHPLDRGQLIELLSNYKSYFLLQYIIFISSALGIALSVYGYIGDKYF